MLLSNLVLLGCLLSGPVWAEESASLTLLSDYQFRGHSLSNGRPSAVAGLAYDAPAGWYAGVSAAPARFAAVDHWEMAVLPYVGYTHSLGPGVTWEIGASAASYSNSSYLNYDEVFLGLAARSLAVRLFLPGRHPGVGSSGPYLELNADHALGERVSVVCHGGVLQASQVTGAPAKPAYQIDLKLGLAMAIDAYSLGVFYVGNVHAAAVSDSYALYYSVARPRDEVLVSLSRSF